ncbi:MAG: hypothetical protein JXR95_04380 [Deltaproteobacteria bacterium]|nr:hypothetical protein [Deltaproteobacteria bacterium]
MTCNEKLNCCKLTVYYKSFDDSGAAVEFFNSLKAKADFAVVEPLPVPRTDPAPVFLEKEKLGDFDSAEITTESIQLHADNWNAVFEGRTIAIWTESTPPVAAKGFKTETFEDVVKNDRSYLTAKQRTFSNSPTPFSKLEVTEYFHNGKLLIHRITGGCK